MRIALLGGSFDPPHAGHMLVCYYLLEVLGFEAVWMVPSFKHPFGKKLAAFEHRVRMCRAAAKFFRGRVRVSTAESSVGKQGHTVDLIEYLLRRHPEHRFSLVIGSDILHEKAAWKDFGRIEGMVKLVVVGRGGFRARQKLSVTMPEVSSTEIRAIIRQAGDYSTLVPATVRRYIEKHGLYR